VFIDTAVRGAAEIIEGDRALTPSKPAGMPGYLGTQTSWTDTSIPGD